MDKGQKFFEDLQKQVKKAIEKNEKRLDTLSVEDQILKELKLLRKDLKKKGYIK